MFPRSSTPTVVVTTRGTTMTGVHMHEFFAFELASCRVADLHREADVVRRNRVQRRDCRSQLSAAKATGQRTFQRA
jgi:hypothetical protein